MQVRKIAARSFAVLAAIGIMSQVSCTSDPTGTGSIATSIEIQPTSATIDALGATQQFQAVVKDQDGEVMSSAQITWSVSGGSAINVTTGGLATAVSNGGAQLLAQAGGVQRTISVTVQQQPHAIVKVSGDAQQGSIGAALGAQLVASVRDRLGNPIAGRGVQFEITGGGGSLTVTSATSSAAGEASTTWTLGTSTAVSHVVSARVTGAPSITTQFTATPLAGPVALLVKVSGDDQTGMVGSLLGEPVVVRVADAFNNPIAGTAVNFQVLNGGGAVNGADVNTNAQGLASPMSWQLGNTPGANVLRVTTQGTSPVDFVAIGTVGPPAIVTTHIGNNQTAAIGTAVTVAPGVRVTDALGNPLAGVAVTFAVSAGGGSITGANALTDATGVGRVASWTLGAPGLNRLTATVAALASVTFDATATAVPANIVIHAGNAQNGTAGSAVLVRPAVRVTTAQGQPVPGVSVNFFVSGGGGTVAPGSVSTDANGVATVTSWTLGNVAGANALMASVNSLAPVTFTATGSAGAPASLLKHAGDNQSTATNTSVSIAPAVRVTDQFGNAVSGVSVSFSVASGGGSVSGSPAVTNSLGIATVTSWTLGAAQGTNELTAQASGLAAVTFSATATAQPASMVAHAGTGQSATVATNVATNPAVRITDALNAPIQGVVVTFTVTAGGGSITGGSAVTDANGVATVGSWTLGNIAGGNTLRASATALPNVFFTATGTAGAAASIAVNAGNNQLAAPGAQVAIAPSVIVRDNFANPVNGVQVTFAVTSGGGSVTGAVTSTVATGVASVGSWTIGAGANTLSATAAGGGISGNPVSFTATGTSTANFNIELRFLTSVTPTQQAAFNAAVVKWQSIITGDLPAQPLNVGAGDCGASSPAVNETIDDLVIFVTLEAIDGVNGVLGSAGPCRIRGAGGGFLPVTGTMRFDTADLASMESSGLLQAVILHEMGHVLGVGTLWSLKGLLALPSLPSSPGVDTHFTGTNAISAFNTIGGAGYVGNRVPVENSSGGAGTRDSHWRESVFDNELMTGFIDFGANPLSVVTILSLQDLGYTVSTAPADAYTLPGSSVLANKGPSLHLHGDVITDRIRIVGR